MTQSAESDVGSVQRSTTEERSRSDDAGAPAVSVRDLRKVYGSGDDAVTAVDGVSFAIEPGTAVGLLGPNGAGKTTAIKCVLALVVPTAGSVDVAGVDVHRNPDQAYERMGAMLEGARNVYWRLTVMENLRFFAAVAGRDPTALEPRFRELLEQFGLSEEADTVVRELSRGQKQKVSLASTMARDADVVFLDEPTLGLDVESSHELRAELRSLVEDESTTVVLSSHDMEVIEDVCDRVIIMNDGRVVADETVDGLLRLFSTQFFDITVDGPIERETRDRLRSELGADDFSRRGSTTSFRVEVDSDEFYDVIDRLRVYDLSVNSVESVEPDLEEVFLRLTDRDGHPAVRPGPSSDDGGS